MADISYTLKATERKASPGTVPGKGNANVLQVLGTASQVFGAQTVGATVKICRIPTSARLSSQSRIYWEDLSTTGSPTLDVGLASVDGNITSDPDALTNGLAAQTATPTGAALLLDPTDCGKPAWEIAGASSDPGGELDVYVTLADTDTAGKTVESIVVEVLGYLD